MKTSIKIELTVVCIQQINVQITFKNICNVILFS